MGDGTRNDVERPRLGGEIYNHPIVPQTAVGTDPQDGLPRVVSVISMEDSKAPPLEPETFVCMGDESAFVIRDRWGDVAVSFSPTETRRAGDEFFIQRSNLVRSQIDALLQVERELREIGWLTESGDSWVKVEPLRPQCVHYRRVMLDFEGDHQSEIRQLERSCTAQRSEGGEYLSLGNTRVHACEHRSPPDFVSEQRLRKFDQARVDSTKKEAPWDPEAALAEDLKKAGESP